MSNEISELRALTNKVRQLEARIAAIEQLLNNAAAAARLQQAPPMR